MRTERRLRAGCHSLGCVAGPRNRLNTQDEGPEEVYFVLPLPFRLF